MYNWYKSDKFVNTINITGQIFAEFCTCWSQDNLIAICAGSIVYIYEVICKPHESDFQIAVFLDRIYANKDQNFCLKQAIDIPSVVSSEETVEERVSLFINSTVLTSTIANEACVNFKRIAWSRRGLYNDTRGCLLATLSYDRRLHVYSFAAHHARLLVSVSDLWSQQFCHTASSEVINTPRKLRQRAEYVSIIDMTWSHTIVDDTIKCAYLFTITRDGHCYAWRVCPADEVVAAAHFLSVVSEPADRVTCVTWLQPDMLLFGRYSGRVDGFRVLLSAQKAVFVQKFILLFDADRVPVSMLLVTHTCIGDSYALMYAVKSMTIVACLFTSTSPTAPHQLIVHWSDFTRLPANSITGVDFVAEHVLMVCTLHCGLFLVRLSGTRTATGPSATLECLSFDSDAICDENYGAQGVSVSPNGAIFVLVQYVSAYYDHLRLREAVRVSFCGRAMPVSECLAHIHTSTHNLSQLVDVLEIIRLNMIDGELAEVEELFDGMHERGCLDNTSSTQRLQLLYILSVILFNYRKRHALPCQPVRTCHNLIGFELLRRSLARVLDSVGTSAVVAGDYNHARTRYTALATSVLQQSDCEHIPQAAVPHMPPCIICDSDVTSADLSTVTCARGHSVALCSKSYMPCLELGTRRCVQCYSHILSDTSELIDLALTSTCNFCDGLCKVVD